ncbi:MAG TPA: hypothetical protein VFB66_30815, partial [Tepidisphaeraceae bacterium]|nr:hypothetical protein [Tepidisphaeraceae bacterium]
ARVAPHRAIGVGIDERKPDDARPANAEQTTLFQRFDHRPDDLNCPEGRNPTSRYARLGLPVRPQSVDDFDSPSLVR